MHKPDFICIGAHKAGTTWLFRQLQSHPDFAMPRVKEFHYFDRNPRYPTPNWLSVTDPLQRLRERGRLGAAVKDIWHATRYREFGVARWWAKYHFSRYTDGWYLSLFDFAGDRLTGDITPGYSVLDEEGVAHLQRVAEHAKIIFLMRNPVDRAWSMMRFDRKVGDQCDDAWVREIIRALDSPGQELRSDYRRTLDLYAKYFRSDQILVGFYDAIQHDPVGLLAAILDHLGASSELSNNDRMSQKFNVAPAHDMPPEIRDHLVKKYAGLIEYLSDRFGGYATNWLDSISMGSSSNNVVKLAGCCPAVQLSRPDTALRHRPGD